ncbi:hypothetical protein [Pseudomonas phage PIP]|nr:hypothetical protein [Pseudomonas phage PIP]
MSVTAFGSSTFHTSCTSAPAYRLGQRIRFGSANSHPLRYSTQQHLIAINFNAPGTNRSRHSLPRFMLQCLRKVCLRCPSDSSTALVHSDAGLLLDGLAGGYGSPPDFNAILPSIFVRALIPFRCGSWTWNRYVHGSRCSVPGDSRLLWLSGPGTSGKRAKLNQDSASLPAPSGWWQSQTGHARRPGLPMGYIGTYKQRKDWDSMGWIRQASNRTGTRTALTPCPNGTSMYPLGAVQGYQGIRTAQLNMCCGATADALHCWAIRVSLSRSNSPGTNGGEFKKLLSRVGGFISRQAGSLGA